jgi:Glycosyltransferase family 87
MPTHALVEPRSFNERSRRRSHWRVRRREEQLARAQAAAQALSSERLDEIEVRFPRPRSRTFPHRVLVVFLIGVMAVFCSIPIANHLFNPPGENKDYDIWYKAGRLVVNGGNLYSVREQTGRRVFEFMYPPVAAVFLAPLTVCGKLPFLLALDAINSLSWLLCLLFAVRLVEPIGKRASMAAYILPAVCTVAYVYDAYLLGQPNLMLLACMLAAFFALRHKKDRTAGALLAFATACKAFPALSLGYLVYRRQWRAAVAMVAFLGLFVVALPAPVRGVSRTISELRTWTGGMLFRYDGTSIAQRPAVSYEWKNASLLAVTHRLLRSVPADESESDHPVYVNIADLSFPSVSCIALALALGLCVACVVFLPPQKLRTSATDAVEFAMLLVLITMFSPISWFYYGVWLLYPFAVVGNYIATLPQGLRSRKIAIAGLAATLLLLNAVFPFLGSIRAVGLPFFGYLLLLIGLAFILRRIESTDDVGRVYFDEVLRTKVPDLRCSSFRPMQTVRTRPRRRSKRQAAVVRR